MAMANLKLFVWKNVRQDYTPGIAFALAENVQQAKEMIKKNSEDWEWRSYSWELEKEPEIYEKPYAFWMSGGG